MRAFRKWILRRVLKSALVFEREARGQYLALSGELGSSAQGGLAHLIQEEETHRRLLEDIVAGRLEDRALEQMLSSHRYHALEETVPLAEAERAAFGGKLEGALREEEATVSFYENLERMSSISSVRLAFRLLADMEREHVAILRRLLGHDS